MLRQAIADVRAIHPFNILAWVLLPDHMHCIWELPDGGTDYSKRWGMIKAGFTRRVHKMIRNDGLVLTKRYVSCFAAIKNLKNNAMKE